MKNRKKEPKITFKPEGDGKFSIDIPPELMPDPNDKCEMPEGFAELVEKFMTTDTDEEAAETIMKMWETIEKRAKTS